MLQVTATEFKTNLGQYLERVLIEDIWITKNGKTVAKLVNPNVSAVDSISGILKGKVSSDFDKNSMRDERISRYALDD
ncbi:MAG: type II toxin-antitoxin system prevent-host-death family antitoxin [Enterococcus sp.]|uniref:type II toxin-antitoxin system Phd/YefM family antitoxin n=1 Tax=Enterococcus sp. TaxID=35783 RepID=UPI00257C39DC|nr:type II toxin-antitoxin system prevent-host-death family antitoxin [Enterococcus sp.]MBR3046577.1 type II toxin-antitoxin system prevent-host-death family antitoxin [Enterococcus sp.]